MVTMAERMTKIETKMESIEDTVLEIKTLLKEHVSEERDYYAGKWTEKTLIGVIITIAGAIVTFLLTRL